MKKGLSIIICCILLMGLLGCGQQNGSKEETASEEIDQLTEDTDKEATQAEPDDTAAEGLEAVFLDEGKADAIILLTQNSTVLIDAGVHNSGARILSFLNERGIDTIDVLIISHYDKDHVGGADVVLNGKQVKQVYMPDYESTGTQYQGFMKALGTAGSVYTVLEQNTEFELDGVRYAIDVANESYYGTNEENDFSLVTSVYYGEVSMLFTGDVENPRIKELIKEGFADYDVLKVPHHGTVEKKSDEFFAAISPDIAVITSSDEEPEDEEILAMLEQEGARTYLTRNGTVTITTDGNELSVLQ